MGENRERAVDDLAIGADSPGRPAPVLGRDHVHDRGPVAADHPGQRHVERRRVDGDYDVGAGLADVARRVLEKADVVGERLEHAVESGLGAGDRIADRGDAEGAEPLATDRDDLWTRGALGFRLSPQRFREACAMDLAGGLRGADEDAQRPILRKFHLGGVRGDAHARGDVGRDLTPDSRAEGEKRQEAQGRDETAADGARELESRGGSGEHARRCG